MAETVALAPLVLGRHEAFVRTVEAVGEEAWGRSSWCHGWTIRDVVVHVAGHVHHTVPLGRRLGDLARSGFRPVVATEREVARHRGRSRAELIDWLRAPLEGDLEGTDGSVQLAELVIHGEDIRRPLGINDDVDPAAVRLVLDHGLTRVGSLAVAGARRRAHGLHVDATDVAWSHGTGSTVRGPAVSLLLALNGRAGALAQLQGPGIDLLAARMPPVP